MKTIEINESTKALKVFHNGYWHVLIIIDENLTSLSVEEWEDVILKIKKTIVNNSDKIRWFYRTDGELWIYEVINFIEFQYCADTKIYELF